MGVGTMITAMRREGQRRITDRPGGRKTRLTVIAVEIRGCHSVVTRSSRSIGVGEVDKSSPPASGELGGHGRVKGVNPYRELCANR